MLEERKERRETTTITHLLKMVDRENLILEGITAMGSYDEAEVSLDTTSGALYIKGHDLHIKHLNLDEGKMEIEGTVNSLIYSDASINRGGKGFLSKLLR